MALQYHFTEWMHLRDKIVISLATRYAQSKGCKTKCDGAMYYT